MDAPEPPLQVQSAWVRARLRVPELERLLGEPQGARIGDNFDSLRVRYGKVVERIGQVAGAAIQEIRVRARVHQIGALVSAVTGVAALVVSFLLPAHRLPAVLIAAGEAVAVAVFAALQKRLARDLLTVHEWGERFRDPLEAARTPEELHRLAESIRAEARSVLGETQTAREDLASRSTAG